MKRALLAAILSMLTACGAASTPQDAGATPPDAGPTLTAFQLGLVSAHNATRASAMPAPSPALPPMAWSASAQALAEDWAARCSFMHRDPNTLGENLYAATREATPSEVVTDWASESGDYTYSSNSCRLGQACGHYTQIVWRRSVGLGCAQQRCTTGSPFGSGPWFLFVCNYDPAGNFVGQKPY